MCYVFHAQICTFLLYTGYAFCDMLLKYLSISHLHYWRLEHLVNACTCLYKLSWVEFPVRADSLPVAFHHTMHGQREHQISIPGGSIFVLGIRVWQWMLEFLLPHIKISHLPKELLMNLWLYIYTIYSMKAYYFLLIFPYGCMCRKHST